MLKKKQQKRPSVYALHFKGIGNFDGAPRYKPY